VQLSLFKEQFDTEFHQKMGPFSSEIWYPKFSCTVIEVQARYSLYTFVPLSLEICATVLLGWERLSGRHIICVQGEGLRLKIGHPTNKSHNKGASRCCYLLYWFYCCVSDMSHVYAHVMSAVCCPELGRPLQMSARSALCPSVKFSGFV
jgi:hypothetical protein